MIIKPTVERDGDTVLVRLAIPDLIFVTSRDDLTHLPDAVIGGLVAASAEGLALYALDALASGPDSWGTTVFDSDQHPLEMVDLGGIGVIRIDLEEE